MRTPFRLLLIFCLVLTAGCAKKYQADNQDMKPNLDPELSNPDFLKIKRPRPLTKLEKEVLSTKTDIPFNLDVKDSEQVQLYFAYFAQDHRDTMVRWLERAAPHLPYIRAVLSTYKLPPDIIALPFIESGYNTMAYSPAGAGGMWQFMPATGRRFGLNIDWWEDERRNPYLSTVAAAKYLSELNGLFNDWNLALAAYNCGEGKMCRVISQSGQNNFFDIAKDPRLLKDETRQYVPKFLAVLKIFKNLDALGFKPVDWGAGQVMEEVAVKPGTDLAALAEACSMNWDDFHRLNAGFRRQVSPPDRESQVYVPVAKKELALAYIANPSCYPARGLRAYSAAAGDSWWNISKRTGVPIVALRQMNPSLGEAVEPGQTVSIPLDGSAQDSALASLDDKPVQRAVEIPRYQPHKLKKNESLASIARQYGVSQGDILKANGLKSSHGLHTGSTLNIPSKNAAVCPVPPAAPSQAKVQQTAEAKSVEVKKGLTLSDIARANKVDVKDLMAANGLKSARDLRAGMHLKIPGGAQAQPEAKPIHEVANVKIETAKPSHENVNSKTRANEKGGHAVAETAKAESHHKEASQPVQTAKAEPAKSAAKPGSQIRHSVENGETVWSIARKFKVDPVALLGWNNLDRSAHLKPGDKITIYTQ